MDRISIFNYEAYYLDFLEGNLNEEDTALLLAFLKENPDLALDDDGMLFPIETEDISLDAQSKMDLIQHGEDEAITAENVEYFMIAAAEGILDPEKGLELETYISAHSGIQTDWAIYQQIHFVADPTLTFGTKEDLKQKTRVLWPYVSLAAAASVAAFFLLWPLTQNNPVEPGIGFIANAIKDQNNRIGHDLVPTNDSVNHAQTFDAQDILADNGSQQGNSHSSPDRKKQYGVDQMDHRPAGNILSYNKLELQPIVRSTFVEDNNSLSQGSEDVAFARMTEMKNPIEPLTKFVSEKTNTEVDFRKSEKGASKDKGFFLKIGSFELSRKKH